MWETPKPKHRSVNPGSFHNWNPFGRVERVHVHCPQLRFQPDLCDLCGVGRPHLLQEKSLRLRGPTPGPLLLSRLRQQAQQSVPGPERTDPLPQRGLLALRLPAVPLPGQYNRSSLGGVAATGNMEPLMLP